jgi:type IV secretion system protein VirB1
MVMDAATFLALSMACAPAVHADTARAIVQVESAFNPWAIGVVGGTLARQPSHRAEALSTARSLQANGWSFSIGLGQINVRNLERLGLSLEAAFEPCTNLSAMQAVLGDCFDRAAAVNTTPQHALRKALSCYYSGTFSTGFQHGYVQRVVHAATLRQPPVSPNRPKEKS